MIKKGGLLLLFFIFLHAEYVVVLSSKDYQKLHNLGVECVKYNTEKYLCYKSDDKYQLKRFVNFAKQNGVSAKIANILTKNLINIYSIQILSTTNKKTAEKYFDKFKNFPFARIEKIGNYYTIRIGASKNKQDLKKLLKKLNIKNAFVRIADIKINRIIKANFLFENDKLKNLFSKKNINKKNIVFLNDLHNKKFITKNKKRLNIHSEKLIQTSGNLKKSCEVYTVLSLVKQDKKYEKLKNNICYKYHMKNLKKLHSDFDKINELLKAMEYKKNINDEVLLNYYKAKTFQSVNVNFLNSLNPLLLDENFYKKYLITLLYAGEISKINYFCKKKNDSVCLDIKKILLNKNDTIANYDIKKFFSFLENIEKNINDNDFPKAQKYINMLYNINKDNVLAKIYDFELNIKENNFEKADKFMNEISKPEVLTSNLSSIIKKARKIEKIKEIKKYLKKNDLVKAQKEIIDLIQKYPNDFDVNVLAGDIFTRLKSYMANYYYHKAYLLDKKRFFYYLLKTGNYKRLMNYTNEDLKKYPNILSKVYLHKALDYLKTDKQDLALKYALMSYKLSPSRENSVIIGKIYFKLKNYKNCIKYLNGFANTDYLKYYLGYCYYKSGNRKKAEKYFGEIINTKNEDLQSKLISVYLKMGDEKKVKKLLNSF